MIVVSLFIIGHMELFFYTEKGSIISVAGVPTTDIIEPLFIGLFCGFCKRNGIRMKNEKSLL